MKKNLVDRFAIQFMLIKYTDFPNGTAVKGFAEKKYSINANLACLHATHFFKTHV